MELELLRANLAKVRIPQGTSKVYKEECCISFANPRSEGGLFVDLNSFLAFGKEYVLWNFEKSGNAVYLNIKRKTKPEDDDRPSKRPTRIAIGMDGGFDPKEPEFEDSYSIVILPQFVELAYPNVQLPEKVRYSVDGVLAAQGMERKDQLTSWSGDKKLISKYANDLPQLENDVVIPPSDWKCAKCEWKENLWLNLTDGMILCGRSVAEGGVGGNGHALQHYQETRYPLAVKLGTLSSDLEAADVFSYPEDDQVVDPLLAGHLAHFGIDFTSLSKTELTTAERELDQNLNFDWNRIQEQGKELQPLFGPGYTGMANLGNSCYLASVMQAVFLTKDFSKTYYENLSLQDAFAKAPADPTLDMTAQLAKLAHGLLSGTYSKPSTKKSSDADSSGAQSLEQDGIPPRMFKSLVGTGHPEFSSFRQQDALDFYQHFLEQVERTREATVTNCFKFSLEERIMCSASSAVKYNGSSNNVLSLGIPITAAVNKEEMAAFERLKAEKEAKGEKLSSEELVRPRVPLSACLDTFSSAEEVQNFYSSAIKGRTVAIKTTKLATFPDYLVMHMKRFVHTSSWVPQKLDVFIDVPDEIDISGLRARGQQPGEVLLPEEEPEASTPGAPSTTLQVDPQIVEQLTGMGFPKVQAEKGAFLTHNSGVEAAMSWILGHLDDPDINDPLPPTTGGVGAQGGASPVDESAVEMLCALGFSADVARMALRNSGNNVERAAEWCLSNPDAETTAAMDIDRPGGGPGGAGASTGPPAAPLPDGPGKYKLVAFVSHMGTSTQCGHYVCHALKDGRWVIFNDAKVAVSENPPKELGYLYFWQRVVE